MVTASELREGMALRIEHEVYRVLEVESKAGAAKMGGTVRAKLSNVRSGRLWDQHFRPLAPQEIPFSLGKREIEATKRKGIACKEVRCLHTSTILFGANRFQFVLVSKSKDSDDVAAIMGYFLAAHGRTNAV